MSIAVVQTIVPVRMHKWPFRQTSGNTDFEHARLFEFAGKDKSEMRIVVILVPEKNAYSHFTSPSR